MGSTVPSAFLTRSRQLSTLAVGLANATGGLGQYIRVKGAVLAQQVDGHPSRRRRMTAPEPKDRDVSREGVHIDLLSPPVLGGGKACGPSNAPLRRH